MRLLLIYFIQADVLGDVYIPFVLGCVFVLVFIGFKLFVGKVTTTQYLYKHFTLWGLLIRLIIWMVKTNNKEDEHKQVKRKLTKTEKQLNKD